MRAFALFGVLVAAAVCSAAHASRSAERSGTIAFLRGGCCRQHLWFVEANGSRVRAGGPANVHGFPVWSPDGSSIAFPVHGPNARLYVADAEGRHKRAITPAWGYACYWLGWSPDGRRILYTLNDDCGGYLSAWVVGADGKGRKRLVPGEGPYDAVWSPDGRTVLYRSYLKRGTGLFVVGADGLHRRRLPGVVPGGQFTGVPIRPMAAWSHDGRSIFYVGADAGLWTARRDGSGARDLTPTLDVLTFDVSRDGKRIALGAVETRGTRDLFVLDVDDGTLHKLTSTPKQMNEDPRWSPDGRMLAFTRAAGFGQQSDIYVMNADGSDQQQVTNSPLSDVAPAWRPT